MRKCVLDKKIRVVFSKGKPNRTVREIDTDQSPNTTETSTIMAE